MSEGRTVDGRNMDENILSSTSVTEVRTTMTEVIHEFNSDAETRDEVTPSITKMPERMNNAAFEGEI